MSISRSRKVNITVSHSNTSNAPQYEVHVDPAFIDEILPADGTSVKLFENDESEDMSSRTVIELSQNDTFLKRRKVPKRRKTIKREFPTVIKTIAEGGSNSDDPDFIDTNYNSKRFRSLDFFNNKHNSKGKRFCSSWFAIPELSSWLAESTIPNRAYCKFCRKDLIAGKSELYKHLNTLKHQRRTKELLQDVADNNSMKDNHSVNDDHNCEDILNTSYANIANTVSVSEKELSNVLANRKITVYMADDMHIPLSKEVKNAFIEHSILDDNIMDKPFFYGKILDLEQKSAKFLGKESAMFVLTGTMANTLAVLGHCDSSNTVVIAGDKSFIYRQCQRTLTRMNETSIKLLRNLTDGRIDTNELIELMKQYPKSFSFGRPKVVCLENPHTYMGGLTLDEQYLQKMHNVCDEYDLSLHMDGARLLHASYTTGVSVQTIASYCDSVVMCLNKGLDTPNGSIISGTKAYIDRCRKLSHVFGLSSVRLECYAAAANKALLHHMNHITRANSYARTIIRGLSDLTSSAVTVSLDCTEEKCTNVIILECDNVRVTPKLLVDRMRETPEIEVEDLKERISIVGKVWTSNSVRLMTHSGLNSQDVYALVKKLKYILQYEFDNYLVLEYVTQ